MSTVLKFDFVLFSFLFLFFPIHNLHAQDLNFLKLIQPAPNTAKFIDHGYQIWCGSMIQGDDKKFYLFYSRWSDTLKHENWVTNSEIAVAVSNSSTGPYKFVKVVLPKRNKKYWDADVTHNPTIHKFGNKYYLYYMGNYGNGKYWVNRNNQRIGVAVANNPLGPWIRFAKPLIDVSPSGYDSLLTSNPAVCKGPNGNYILVYKSVANGPMPFGGKVYHRVAFSKSPEGPFIKQPDIIFQKDTVRFPAEDPFIWYQSGKFRALVKDFKGYFTNAGLSLALFESDDAINWSVSKNALALKPEIIWKDSVQKVARLERPQLYIEKDIPKVLFVAIMDYDGKTFNVGIPLSFNPK